MHFLVLTIGDDIESILDPYDANYPDLGRYTKEEIVKLFREYWYNSSDAPSDEEVWMSYLENWNDPDPDNNGRYEFYDSDYIALWDWYEVGGRWGFLARLKVGGIPMDDYSRIDNLDTLRRISQGLCNSALLRDVVNLPELLGYSKYVISKDGIVECPTEESLVKSYPDETLTLVDCHI